MFRCTLSSGPELLRSQLEHASAVVDDVQFSGSILSEGTDVALAGKQKPALPVAAVLLQHPDRSADIVAEYIGSGQSGNGEHPVDVSTRNRLPLIVPVFCNGHLQTVVIAALRGLVTMEPFHDVPAVVAAALEKVDFLPAFWPTSATNTREVGRSKEKRHGFRNP